MEATAMNETKALKIVREPSVHLVGRQVVDPSGVEQFLNDHELTWVTDTEVGGERLAEMAGRVCYMSYGKGRRTNRESSNRHCALRPRARLLPAAHWIPCGPALRRRRFARDR